MTPTPALAFRGVVTLCNWPSQVQFVFSLRNEAANAVVLPARDIQSGTRLFEQGPGTQGWEEIDYAETSFFVHSTENLELEAVFVLDFTDSMAQAHLADGRTGIQALLDALPSAISAFPPAHRIGAVELHDRNVDPTVLESLGTDRSALLASVNKFATSPFDSGSSRVWDAVEKAVSLYTNVGAKPNVVRALIVLSDGRDTSSTQTMQGAFALARKAGVQVYFLSTGQIAGESDLSRQAVDSGGGYYRTPEIDDFKTQLGLLVQDIKSQYKFSYVTLRKQGTYTVRAFVQLGARTGSFDSPPLDISAFYAPDNLGQVSFDPPTVDWTRGQATFYVRALHLPRNINRFRFKLDTTATVRITLVQGREGGLLEGWTLGGPDAEGYIDVSSARVLDFGNLGLLFRIDLVGLTGREDVVPVTFDNSIYSGSKAFEYPTVVRLVERLR